ncbi:hypothetical protein GCM10009868_11840 [Terrabacter aerolatus]|uniref:DUF4192 domain-containing protein n=1 Tax=Terrabacter aerolatus TaxID=422442 RepID=A0A512CYG0_9MICO|nr:DUF4192 domain-containing protein [Terrabacter aerolatus]GEO29040.1 hypothetical protein TAE01_08500 [Terrabacter aerolatus]
MPKISLSGPAELLTIIPFHLGFQPERSVVVVCFHGKRLGLVARLDVVDPTLAAEAVAQTLPTLLQGAPSSVAVVGFEDVPDESLPLLEALAGAVESERVVVRERLVVRGGRWRSVGCDCCPEEGWLLPEQADVPAVASYVALGHAVLPDREELARLVEPLAPSEPRHGLAVAAVEDWQRRYAASGGSVSDRAGRPGRRAARRAPSPGSELGLLDGGDPSARQFLVNDALVAWGGVLRGEVEGYGIEHWLPSLVGPLRDVEFRDALIGWLCPGTVPLDSLPDELVVMLDVLLGPGLRLAPASDGPDRDGGGGSDVAPWSGDDVASRLTESDLEALRALHALLDLGPGGQGEHEVVGELCGPGGSEAHAADGRDHLDDPDDAEQDGSWDDWDEASAPRVVLGRIEQVCRLTPAAHAAPLLSVVGSLAWWCGDGARAGVAVDQALALEPGHRLSRLVRESLDHGIRPSRCA